MELKKEEKWLLECLGNEDLLCRSDRLAACTISDWDGVVHQAARHSVAPLLYKRLHAVEEIPVRIRETLRQAYLRNTVRNVRLYHGIAKIIRLLSEAHIPVIVLKGAHLAERVYGDPGLRSMDDMDLLIKKSDLPQSQKLLRRAGYYTAQSRFPLDIHWTLDFSVPDFRVDMDQVWARAHSAKIGGVETLVLAPEDLLLYLCLHFAFHHLVKYSELRALADILETMRHYGNRLDWAEVANRAKQWRVTNPVSLAFMLLMELFRAETPEVIRQALQPDKIDPAVKAWALEQVFLDPKEFLHLSPYFWQLWGKDSLREKSMHLFRLLFTPREFVAREYGAPFNSLQNDLYYFIRLKEHAARYVRAVWRLILGDKEMKTQIERQNRNLLMEEWFISGKSQ